MSTLVKYLMYFLGPRAVSECIEYTYSRWVFSIHTTMHKNPQLYIVEPLYCKPLNRGNLCIKDTILCPSVACSV